MDWPMGWDDIGESVCPIARSLAVLGDRWTMLIIRELFLGTRRFDAFQTQTGMSSHLLSTRLKRLEDDGVIERRLYQTRPRRYEYRLTTKGKDLHGVVLALRAWGLRWCGFDPADEPAVKLIHTSCGGEVGSDPICRDCGEQLHSRNITVTFGDAFAAEREARRASFAARKPAT
jgi:DNA-binding HxlR family transcriptional regulator